MIKNESLSSKRVLLVDDDSSMRELLTLLLERDGWQVGTAKDGAAGLALFEASQWDVIVTDQMMPKMSGEALAAAIRHRSPSVPIVMMTGMIDAIQDPQLFAALLAKPFSGTEFVECLEGLISALV